MAQDWSVAVANSEHGASSMDEVAVDTVWVLGDQLHRHLGALGRVEPGEARVLLVTARDKVTSKRWHRQRLHLVLTSMRRFAQELRDLGFDVDERHAPTMADGLRAHTAAFDPGRVMATEPANWDGRQLLERLEVELVRNDHFTCHYEDFADWAEDRDQLRMEDFYRWQRRRLGYLMDGDEPAGGRWNFDQDNREPPDDDLDAPVPATSALDQLDREVLASLPDDVWGAEPDGTWATSRRRALARLRHFTDDVLPAFGDHQDAMVHGQWHLNHSLISHALNLGMLDPREVCDAVEDAYRDGRVPINAAEGFIRQVIGWREYIWGVYWLWMPEYRDVNELDATMDLPPVFTDDADTDMRCVADTMTSIREHAYAHHIQRLMVIANLCTTAGVDPAQLTDWMWASFVDGAEWVMLPNVLGMGTFADGGRMSSKPYVSAGAYIDRMSEGYCSDCRFDRKARVGEDACPFTTLYWDFLDNNREVLEGNHRLGRPYANLDRLSDVEEVRARAAEVKDLLARGRPLIDAPAVAPAAGSVAAMDDPEQVTVERVVDADPRTVWERVSDVTRMGELSPENDGARWLGDADGPAVGARFRGTNTKGWRRWSTTGEVVVCEPGSAFAFEITSLGLPVSRWSYELEATDDGTRVSETWTDQRSTFVARAGALLTGVRDRAAHNRASMNATLDALIDSVSSGS